MVPFVLDDVDCGGIGRRAVGKVVDWDVGGHSFRGRVCGNRSGLGGEFLRAERDGGSIERNIDVRWLECVHS